MNPTMLHSSLSSVYFPDKADEFPVIFFIGGLNGYVWVEWYSTYLKMLASHGFFVIGVDYIFPAMSKIYDVQLNQDISKFFQEIDFVRFPWIYLHTYLAFYVGTITSVKF